MMVRRASHADVEHVARSMRDHSWREMMATRDDFDIKALLAELEAMTPLAMLRCALCSSFDDDTPIAIFVAYRASQSVAMFQTFSTNAWWLIAKPFIRWFNRDVARRLELAGIRMAEMNVLAENGFDARWFALINIRPVGPPLPRGAHGELYQAMVWLPDWATVDVAGAGACCASREPTGQGAKHV